MVEATKHIETVMKRKYTNPRLTSLTLKSNSTSAKFETF